MPKDVADGQEAWKAQQEKVAGIPELSHDDMEWAEGCFFSAPTRYGAVVSQVRAFIDAPGGLWMQGKLANKTFIATTSAQNANAGRRRRCSASTPT